MNLGNKNTPKKSSNKYWNFMAHHDGTDWWHSVLKKGIWFVKRNKNWRERV